MGKGRENGFARVSFGQQRWKSLPELREALKILKFENYFSTMRLMFFLPAFTMAEPFGKSAAFAVKSGSLIRWSFR